MSNFYISSIEIPPHPPSKALRPPADLRPSSHNGVSDGSALRNENLKRPPFANLEVTKEYRRSTSRIFFLHFSPCAKNVLVYLAKPDWKTLETKVIFSADFGNGRTSFR